MKKILVVLALVLTPFYTWAAPGGMQLSPSFSYFNETVKQGSTDSGDSGTLIDIKLGYLMDSGIYIGGLYTTNSYSQKSGATTTTGALTAYGPSLGYFYRSLFLIFTYGLSAERTYGSTTYKKGTATQFDFGYLFSVGSSFSIGPSLSIRSYTYKETNTGALTNERVEGDTRPYINFWFSF